MGIEWGSIDLEMDSMDQIMRLLDSGRNRKNGLDRYHSIILGMRLSLPHIRPDSLSTRSIKNILRIMPIDHHDRNS